MDASGLTFNSFEKWNPAQAVDTSQEPAPMIINSSQLRVAGFKLDKVIPSQLEAVGRSGMCTRGAGLRQLRGMGSALSTSPIRVARSSTLFGGRSKGMLREFGFPCAAYLVLAFVAAVVHILPVNTGPPVCPLKKGFVLNVD